MHFHMLHDHDQVRVRQRMVHPGTERAGAAGGDPQGLRGRAGHVRAARARRARRLAPEPSRDIELTRFVPPARSSPTGTCGRITWDRTAPERYCALARRSRGAAHRHRPLGDAQASATSARCTPRRQLRAGHAAHARRGRRRVASSGARRARALEQRELALAEQLIEALARRLRPAAFHDEHRERVLELIEAKRQGQAADRSSARRARRSRLVDRRRAAGRASSRAKGAAAVPDDEDNPRAEDEAGAAERAARPFWSGTLSFGLVSIPVSLYRRVRGAERRAAHARPRRHAARARATTAPKRRRRSTADELVRGYELDDGQLRGRHRRGARGGSTRRRAATSTCGCSCRTTSSTRSTSSARTCSRPRRESTKAYRLLAADHGA